MQKVVELIRVSRNLDTLLTHFSLPTQRATNRRTAQAHRLQIVRTIELVNVSGAAILKAPEMHALLDLIRQPEISGVVIYDFSRLMRPDSFTDYILLQAFHDSNTILYLPEGPVDFGTKDGRFMGAIRAAIAGLQRGDFVERIWVAKEAQRKAGKHPGGEITLPYGVGYDKIRSRWFYTPEADKVKEAFRLFVLRQEYRPVARTLGITRSTLRYILRNPIYVEWRVIDQRRDPSPSALKTRNDGRQPCRVAIMRSPDEIIRVRVIDRPLVKKEIFDRVQEIIKLKKQRYWKAEAKFGNQRIFRGFLQCNECGGRLSLTAAQPEMYYFCRNRGLRKTCDTRYQHRTRLEREINKLLGERITSPHFLKQVEFVAGSAPSNHNCALDRGALMQGRQEVLDSYVEGTMSREEAVDRLETIKHQLGQAVLARPQNYDNDRFDKKLIQRLAAFANWTRLGAREKKRILTSLECTIHVQDYLVCAVSICGDRINFC
jgi:DNA invertase Pin-like site-specific DNA recombinase